MRIALAAAVLVGALATPADAALYCGEGIKQVSKTERLVFRRDLGDGLHRVDRQRVRQSNYGTKVYVTVARLYWQC